MADSWTRRRATHPGAWWLWSLTLAAAASHTTNPLLLGLIIAIAGLVVAARRTAAPWAVGFRWYLAVAALVVVLRVTFRMLTAGAGPTVLFTLPEIALPEAAAGVSLLGEVSAEALLAGFYDGLRLATMIVCVGAAAALANPKRLLAAMPSALYEVGTVLVVSVSVFPQLVEAVGRVRRAQALRRGPRTRRHRLRTVVVPVLTDALDRSLLLAASMDSRGYGRSPAGSERRRLTSACLLAGVGGVAIGAYGLLDAQSPWWLGTPVAIAGVVVGALGFRLAGARVHRSRYRPDPWRGREWLVAGTGAVAAAAVFAASPAQLYPSANPLMWPALPVTAALGLLVAVIPALPAGAFRW
ncbi:energy-coupling factor transporter transmembrane component T [Nakamurella deserti]|uniref:energy-coupling factor transporter transmembrane component T n=1 Tax=Nakamurella deserti TaxID=2164074 RepID=UPI000DBE8E92|nr:energy-coupling factor transporter transmembrane component T [Nakamurella deserti]